jgi:putative transposase
MKLRFSGHGAYYHLYHIVWIAKYRRKILQDEIKTCIEQRLVEISQYHPDVEIERYNIQVDHVHLVMVIPPKYSVSSIVGKLKANSSRAIHQQFPGLHVGARRDEFWSPGFFSSTVGVNEAQIKRYVELQEKIDKGQLQLSIGF